ncbi:hypothetical protein BB561_003602 [Smittium simulii]|uniref:Origin recognition complex subunit 3 N-terminal domain-containing protein n=1 Tax=Smittium simulii TaxID=133385 RepID=A0A2T9YKF9_9FUNG|nr:hypothetical protein BB561_003602 [Smittium simulii]
MAKTTIDTSALQSSILTQGFSIEYNEKNSVKDVKSRLFQDTINNKESEFHIKLRQALLKKKWDHAEKIINHEIKTALVFTGMNVSENTRIFQILQNILCSNNISDPHRNITVRLNSKNSGNLKNIISHFIDEFIKATNDTSFEGFDLAPSNYDMEVFENYFKFKFQDTKPRVVVMLENLEGFAGNAVSDFIAILSKYLLKSKIPIILVLGVSTTTSTVNKILMRSALQKMNISKFSLGAAQELINKIIFSLFIESNNCLNFGFTAYKYIIKQFLHSNLSIYQFKSILKYSFMDFFYGNPLSILSTLIINSFEKNLSLEEINITCTEKLFLTTSHMDLILMQPSVMR